MPLSEIVLVVAALLAVAIVAAGALRALPVPHTVVLVVIGMALGESARRVQGLEVLHGFRLDSDVVFFVFLPALIFESGLNLDARQLVKDLAPVLILAVLALLLSAAIVGVGLTLALGMALPVALLFGALVSATDPVAVVALFREIGAPARLTVLVEGESLLNDATAIVLFAILLAMVEGGGALAWSDAARAVLDFAWTFAGGAVVGAALGAIGSELLYRLRSGVAEVLAMSLVLAYASFAIAEHVLHVSGVMAAAGAAVALGAFGVTRMSQETGRALGETWELVALVCNSLLFVLIGLSVDPVALAERASPIALAVALVLAARGAGVAALVPLSTRAFSLPRIAPSERCIMWWGGLKGGLAIAMALSIPEDVPARGLLLDLTLGVVLFTLLVNAPTVRPLMRRLGMDRLTPAEALDLSRALAEARGEAERTLDRFVASGAATRATGHRVGRRLARALATEDAPDEAPVGADQRARHAYLSALRTELAAVTHLRDVGLIGQYTFFDMRSAIARDREAHGPERARFEAAASGGASPFLRIESALLRRLREHDRAAPLLAAYQRVRLAHRIEHDLAGVLACRAVLDALAVRDDLDAAERADVAGAYERRLEARAARLRELRRDFPDFYSSFEARVCARVALAAALERAAQHRRDGALGAKPYARLQALVEGERRALPPVSAPVAPLEPRELIGLVPLFAGLPAAALERLAARAAALTALPGDELIGAGERGDALYIVTRGELEAFRRDADGTEHRLGRLVEGDFFGEMALLGEGHVRTATVRARLPSALLRIARAEVLALAEAEPEVRDRLEAARRGRARANA